MMNWWHDAWDESDLRWLAYSGLAACVIVLGLLLLTFRPAPAAPAAPAPPPLAISTVLLSSFDGTSHGTGVHIGDGLILTAAHVVDSVNTFSLTDSQRRKQMATVLWASKAYDVALVRVEDASGLATARLDCDHSPEVGDRVSAFGNPLKPHLHPHMGSYRLYHRRAWSVETRVRG